MTTSFVPDLQSVVSFVDRCSEIRKIELNEVNRNLEKLDEFYVRHGLREPFRLSISSNRAFSGGREEVYSDWFQWIITQIIDIHDHYNDMICDLLEIDKTKLNGTRSNMIMREVTVPEGHPDQKGRIDILLNGPSTVVSIEVKIANENMDLKKNIGYEKSIKGLYGGSGKEILFRLILSTSKENFYCEHKVITWDNICRQLRRCAIAISKEIRGQRLAPLLLGFVGAVEQCVLKYNVDGFVNSDTITYIEEVFHTHE